MKISEYIKSGIEPFPDSCYVDGFRCSAYLKDGTFLPCVVIRKNKEFIDLACRRFEDEKSGKSIFSTRGDGYRQIVKTFVAGGNRVNDYDIASLEGEIVKLADQLKDKYSLQKNVEVVFSLSNFYLLEPKNN